MMISNRIRVAGALLAIPVVLWLTGPAFGFGKKFDKPGVPEGARLMGPAGKGTLVYIVNGGLSTITFEGRCKQLPVSTGPIDVSAITDSAAFSAATKEAVADEVEGWFVDVSSAVTPFEGCYKRAAFGIFVSAVNKSLAKTTSGPVTVWVGEVTIQGVR